MNFICDVHIPYKLVNFLGKSGHIATHVNQILDGSYSKDIDISRNADAAQAIVITKDEDFENLHFAKGTPLKLIRIILGNITTSELIAIFQKHIPDLEKINQSPQFFIEIGKDQLMYTADYELN